MLISTLLMGLLAYSTLRSQQLKTWEKILQTQAADIEFEITLTLTQQRWFLEQTALSEEVRNAIIAVVEEEPSSIRWKTNAGFLQESLLVPPPRVEIDEFLVLNANTGYVTLSNHHTKERLPFQDIWFFQTTLRGTHVSVSRSCGQNPCTIWGTPVYDWQGRRVAVLIMVFPLDPFYEITAKYRQWSGINQEILLIDESRHNLLASEEKSYHMVGANLAFTQHNGTAVYLNSEGKKVLGAYRYIKPLHAALLLEVPYGQTMATVNRATLFMLAAGLGLLLVLLLIESFVANVILTPVKHILDGMEHISTGDLDVQLPELKHPELSWMARRFNHMVQELKNTYLEVETQKKSYASLFEESPDGIVLLDTNGIIIQHNLGWLEMLRLTAQNDLTGKPIQHYFHISPIIWETLLSKKRLRMRGHLHLPDGDTCPTDVRCKVLETGEVQMIFTDISDQYHLENLLRKQQYQLEQQIQQRTAQLQIANQDMEAFTYSISHDLRAPLRAIRGYLTIFLEEHGSQLTDEQRSLLEKIRASAERLSDMIQHLLTISRLGRQAMHLQLFSSEALRNMIEEIIQELQMETPAYARTVVEIQPLHPCTADPTLFRQVWQNLLSNAFKFSSAVPEPHITIGSFKALDGAGYFVHDNGIGFDPAYSNKLFTPFQRLHGSDFPGYGAGLAIVHRVIQRHNGRIWAESTPGMGATFYFTIAKDIPDVSPKA